jgi:hypothetical protein
VHLLAARPRGLGKKRRIGVTGFLKRETAYFLGIRFALFGGGEELPHRPDQRRIATCPSFLPATAPVTVTSPVITDALSAGANQGTDLKKPPPPWS